MTPGARISAAIELLDAVLHQPNRPADAVTGLWLRQRRYIGGGDRRWILDHVYGALRRRAQLSWWLDRVAHGKREHGKVVAEAPPLEARPLVLAALILVDGWTVASVSAACDGGKFRPERLGDLEAEMLRRLEGHTLDHPAQPRGVRFNLPDWIEPLLAGAFGDRFDQEMAALNETATVDLRANALVGTREQALSALKRERLPAEPTKFSPWGLRLPSRTSVVAGETFQSGLIEVQDEGSQLVALLVGARPGMQVVDYCAGAGGKTLAMAACMENKGQVIACDVSAGRLERSAQRLRRAGAHNVRRMAIDAEGRKWLKRHAGRMDRVLVDAPCTGVGTWRRNPDGRWTLRPLDLEELIPKQAEILDAAAKLTRPGGRLVYATCSLLPQENEEQIDRFLAAHPEYELVPADRAWREALGAEPPADATPRGYLRLSPARHGVDGFFAAVLERKADAASAVAATDDG